jgi:hypothetical protein
MVYIRTIAFFFSFVVRLRNPAGFLLGILEKNWYLAKKKKPGKVKSNIQSFNLDDLLCCDFDVKRLLSLRRNVACVPMNNICWWPCLCRY